MANTKLTDGQIAGIVNELTHGASLATVAKKYKVNRNTVRYHARKHGVEIVTAARGSDNLKAELDELKAENVKLKVMLANRMLREGASS